MNKLIIKDLNFQYDDKTIFTNFNLTLKKGLTFLIGNNGSGKSTLFKILSFKLPCLRNIYIDDLEYTKKSKDVFVLTQDYVNSLSGKVSDIVAVNDETKKIITYFDLNNYLDFDYKSLALAIKIKIAIALILINDYSIIFVDDVLCWLNKIDRNKVLKKFRTISKKKIILVATNNVEDSLYGSRVILLDKGKIILDDNLDSFYNNEEILKNCGIRLPFMVDLSINLKLYNTINDIYFDMEKLVDDIWK